jgi:hypothetical protein
METAIKQTDTKNVLDKVNEVRMKQKFLGVAVDLTTGEDAAVYHEDIYSGLHFLMNDIGDDLDEIAGLLEKN